MHNNERNTNDDEEKKNHTQLCRHSVKSINETRQRIVEQSELREANQLYVRVMCLPHVCVCMCAYVVICCLCCL